jgi:putative iron-regulated protein
LLLLLLWWVIKPATHPIDPIDRAASHRKILYGYRQVAYYSYEGAYHALGRLRLKIDALVDQPSAANLQAARLAWREAHRDYAQTEALRFGHWIVDDWETAVNAWPVDEGLLDYVNADYAASPTNPLAQHNLVAEKNIVVNGLTLDTDQLDWTHLKFIHGGSDNETVVALGYHALEFLLWGQDAHLADTGSGERPWTDYDPQHCTSGSRPAPAAHCLRRGRMLRVMTDHLYTELNDMTIDWGGSSGTSYGLHIITDDPTDGLRRMLYGMVRLANDEMTGDRLQVALMTHAAEEEQDCFSDDSHQSAYYNLRGLQNFYYGRYQNAGSGANYQAPLSLAQVAAQQDPALAVALDQAFQQAEGALARLQRLGESGQTLDLLIRPEHAEGKAAINAAIASLNQVGQRLEQLGQVLGLGDLNPRSPLPASPAP